MLKPKNPGYLPSIIYFWQRFCADGKPLSVEEIGDNSLGNKDFWMPHIIEAINVALMNSKAKWGTPIMPSTTEFFSKIQSLQKKINGAPKNNLQKLKAISSNETIVLSLFIIALCDEVVKQEIIDLTEHIGSSKLKKSRTIKKVSDFRDHLFELAVLEGRTILFSKAESVSWQQLAIDFNELTEKHSEEVRSLLNNDWPTKEMGRAIKSKGKNKLYANWSMFTLVSLLSAAGMSAAEAKKEVMNLFDMFQIHIKLDTFLMKYRQNPIIPIPPDQLISRVRMLRKILSLTKSE